MLEMFVGPLARHPREVAWGLVGLVFQLALIGLLAWAVITVVRQWGSRPGAPAPPPGDPGRSTSDPERLLAWRYAQGEIDDDEYRRRLDVLRSTSAPWQRQS